MEHHYPTSEYGPELPQQETALAKKASELVRQFEQACDDYDVSPPPSEEGEADTRKDQIFGTLSYLPAADLPLARHVYTDMTRSPRTEVRLSASLLMAELAEVDLDTGLRLLSELLEDDQASVRKSAFGTLMIAIGHSVDVPFRQVQPLIFAYLRRWRPDTLDG